MPSDQDFQVTPPSFHPEFGYLAPTRSFWRAAFRIICGLSAGALATFMFIPQQQEPAVISSAAASASEAAAVPVAVDHVTVLGPGIEPVVQAPEASPATQMVARPEPETPRNTAAIERSKAERSAKVSRRRARNHTRDQVRKPDPPSLYATPDGRTGGPWL
jgi:hypothetical protein